MVKDGEQEKRIAAEIDDFFLQFTEILWAHISSYYKRDKKTSLNITEHFIVEFLGKESFASMSKLAKIIYVAPTTMTSIVDRLIKRGLLQRRRAQQDRRKILVTLSEEGRQFYERYHQNSLEFYSIFLSALPDKGKAFIQNLQGIKGSFPYLKELFEESRKNI
ncbi:MAG TPA: MarR family transcriptional regulator [Atribacterota bacterium]|nr:MarR family transcriptional regulator [Atribacterota bacterium]